MSRKLFAILFAALFVCTTAFTIGCSHSTGDDDDAGCSQTSSDWSCENGICSCEDDTSCTDPDETTADDPDNCDNACEVCLD